MDGLTLCFVLLIRYFAETDGHLIAATVTYAPDGQKTMQSCEEHKKRVDAQPDPPGTTTKVDCLEERDIPKFLVPGQES